MESKIHLDARDLKQEPAWLAHVLDTGFKLYFDQEPEHDSVFDVAPPDLSGSSIPGGAGFPAMLESANDSMAQVRGTGRWLSR